MKKEKISIGRLGPAVNLRAGGVMASATRKRDRQRDRKSTKQSLRSGDWD